MCIIKRILYRYIPIKVHLGEYTVYETRVKIVLYHNIIGTDVYTDITHYIIPVYNKLYYYYYTRCRNAAL